MKAFLGECGFASRCGRPDKRICRPEEGPPIMYTFPIELIDAGRLDGCSEWGIVVRIVIPALKNAFMAVFILRFVWAYKGSFKIFSCVVFSIKTFKSSLC